MVDQKLVVLLEHAGEGLVGDRDRALLIRLLRPVIEQIERSDRDLGNQLRRCASSVALNMAEASGSRGGNRTVRYRSALGSTRETMACLDVAVALGYVEHVDVQIRESLEAVRRVLTNVVA